VPVAVVDLDADRQAASVGPHGPGRVDEGGQRRVVMERPLAPVVLEHAAADAAPLLALGRLAGGHAAAQVDVEVGRDEPARARFGHALLKGVGVRIAPCGALRGQRGAGAAEQRGGRQRGRK